MNFSFSDYQAGLASGLYAPPGAYCPFMRVNRAQYKAMEEVHEKNKNDIARAFRELRRRVCGEYYWKTYPVQVQALDYSQMSFPAYRFILPEVLADDWLAIVGWHKKFHRDHVLHQPLTAYVVQKLLKDSASPGLSFLLSDGRSLLDACINEILKWDSTAYLKDSLLGMGVRESEPWLKRGPASRTLWKCLFLETAYVAAMFHDMGYPWQYVNLLGNKLDQAGYQSESPTSDAERLVSAFGNRLLYAPLNGYRVLDNNTPATWRQRLLDITAKAVRGTHGFPGAIGFLYLNDVLRDFPADRTHPIKQFCVEWAAMAIMMHDMRGIYWGDDTRSPPDNDHVRLKFEVDPLSCVITLADVLQDFSRPAAAFRENAASVDVSYRDGCDSARLELDWTNPSRAMKIVYCFSDPREHASKLSFLPKDRREFFDEEYGYLDLSAVGIRGVEMEAELAP